ncbi:two-component system sensor histidine kinase NtrB [Candidatus Nitrospira nitrificans]|uniref:histidine kinase n=1 Tax=Candidatus Nitrospira nitrificans TaxID=1742973 RepID=A0A0S4L780_9BACT|nr:ATP-binding protein [Candidatus Nitrospira nitrificans]CUS31652.1 putative Sensor histidine kinase FleS [Candidatus Nitrospira nitrificans]
MTSAATRHPEERELLHAAFRSFDEAAQTLQQSYSALTTRVEQMDLELAHSNEALRRHLCDNEAMRVHLDGILESLSTGVLVLDDRETITRSNRAAEMLLGATDDALRNRRASEILAGAGLGLCDRPQRIGQAVVSISQVPLHNDSGEHTGHLILFQDVTRVYQLEEQLQRKERLAAMGELIGRIAHEIRNPLGSVELFASMLQRDLGEQSSAKRYAQQISQAVQSMDRLLSNLLLYTRPVRLACGWHAAESLIDESIKLAAHAMSKVPVDIRVDIGHEIRSIWCHDGQLKQVLVNLVLNAIQAMPNGGVVAVSLCREQLETLGLPAVRLSVRDSGIGIDPAHRSRIFDPFFSTKDEGTGLGLAIVYSIVDAHQGRIDVESAVGQGTTCSIILPHPAVGGDPHATHVPTRNECEPNQSCPVEHHMLLAEECSHE